MRPPSLPRRREGRTLNQITKVLKYQTLLTIAPVARHIVAVIAATSIGTNGVNTVGIAIWRAGVTSDCTFIDVLTSCCCDRWSITRIAMALIRALRINTPRVWWATIWSFITLVDFVACVRTSVSPTNQAVAIVWTYRINTQRLHWTSISIFYALINVFAYG